MIRSVLIRSGLLAALALSLSACMTRPMSANSGSTEPQVQRAVACAEGYMRPDFDRLQADLSAARTRWQAAAISSYAYDFAQYSLPVRFPAVRVTVSGGAVQSVALKAGEEGEPSAQARATVEDLFQNIADALAYQRGQPCPAVETDYDAQDGHPTRLYSGIKEANSADGEGEWNVTGFERR
ncbi:hypothetical protein E7T06_16590 [Deinococcus sp. Arct2-2]|uniref:DUF6174 domain-containing protein n=1 Tax=Deinococcus sp. Arct2-2 TaxID=2568653 RepID=UPI0010A47924|nr:DUF6174 domain-containing protein [Deinococcus sp. Arct2-2]THF68443.1 hypothetical protein E7T06_16590 [Deinococcus sp. Arct2-2]